MDRNILRDCVNETVYFELGKTIDKKKKKLKNNLKLDSDQLLSEEEKEKIVTDFTEKNMEHNLKQKLFSQKYQMPNLNYFHFNCLSEYNFDEMQSLYFLLNFDYFFEKYGYLIEAPMHQTYYYRTNCGIGDRITYDIRENYHKDELYYNYAFFGTGVDFIKKRFNTDMNLPIGIHNYICLKNIMIDVDLDSISKKYKNINLEEIVKLNILCHNHKSFFEHYLKIMDKCDLEKRNLIFQFIEPFSFQYTMKTKEQPFVNNKYLEFVEYMHNIKSKYWLYLLTYIFDYNQENNIKFHYDFALLYDTEFYNRYKEQNKLNTFFMKEFEYFFLELYPLIEKIINLENWKEIFEILLKIKEHLYNNMPDPIGKIEVIDDNETSVNYVKPMYHEAFDTCAEEHNKYIGEVSEISNYEVQRLFGTLDFNILKILKLKKGLSYFFQQLKENITIHNIFTEKNAREIIDLINCLVLDEDQKIELNNSKSLIKKL